MTVKCSEHDLEMKLIPAGISKNTKKPYNAFMGCPNFSCKKTAPVTNEDPESAMETFTKDLDAENKHEAHIQLDGVAKKETETVEDKPMTRKDWDIKDLVVGLGVFSSPARKEGMDPATAFRDMHIWEWMDVAYGGGKVYEEWKASAKKRIK